MKTISKIAMILLLTIWSIAAFSQTVKTSVYSPFKLSGKGVSTGVQLPGFIGDMEFGAFFETHTVQYGNVEQGTLVEKTTHIKGAYASFSVVSVRKWDINLGAKLGTAGSGLVVSPNIGVDYYVSNYFGIGTEAKVEVMKPVLQAKLFFNIFGAQNRIARQSKYKENKDYFRSLRRNRY